MIHTFTDVDVHNFSQLFDECIATFTHKSLAVFKPPKIVKHMSRWVNYSLHLMSSLLVWLAYISADCVNENYHEEILELYFKVTALLRKTVRSIFRFTSENRYQRLQLKHRFISISLRKKTCLFWYATIVVSMLCISMASFKWV